MKRLYYGWVIVICSAGLMAFHGLFLYTFGVFFKPLVNEFNWERGILSGAHSTAMLVTGVLSLITGMLCDRLGPRALLTVNGIAAGAALLLMSRVNSLWQVYLFWGLLMGIANAAVFIPITTTVPRWFGKNKGASTGLTLAGIGVGGVMWPIISQWLISDYGWRQAYVILGITTIVVVIPLAQFIKSSPQGIDLKRYEEREATGNGISPPAGGGLTLKQAVKKGSFWIIAALLFFEMFYAGTITVHISPHALDIGISAVVAAGLLSALSASQLTGRLLTGFVSDKIGTRLTATICLFMALLGLVWLQFAREAWMLYAFVIFFGVWAGGIFPTQIVITAEIFGLKCLGVILATLVFFGTIGNAIGPALGGGVFDVTGSYRLAFITIAILCAGAFILSLVLLRLKEKPTR
ncbi:MAG: MFS transporter [Chloroflexota bacterium]